jgi:hypothetical protein
VEPVTYHQDTCALLDSGLYRFLAYYYRDSGVTLLKPWRQDYPLVGWEIPFDRQADLAGLLHFVGPERHPAAAGDFAFESRLSARRQAQHPCLVDNPTFCLRHFDTDRLQVVGGLIGNYFDAIDTCDVLESEWDLRHHVYRELAEEVFNYDEKAVCGMTARDLYRLPDVRLLQHLDLWSEGRMCSEEEIVQQIGDVSPAHIVVPGAAALWFGFRAAKRRIPQVLDHY